MESDFFRTIHRFRKLMSKIKVCDISHVEFFMLGAIYHGKVGGPHNNKSDKSDCGIKVSELNGIVKGSKSATSKMLKNLEEKGFIERISDSKDKRNVYIKLSNLGEERFSEAKHRMHTLSGTVIDRMGEDDMMKLIKLCNKLYMVLDDEVSKLDPDRKETNQ